MSISFGNQYFGSQGSVILFENYLFILTAKTELCKSTTPCQQPLIKFLLYSLTAHI